MKNYIFIVDDEPDMVRHAADLLQVEGYRVGSATDPVDGLEKIKTQNPDLVLLDVRMPKLTGYDLCKKLKEEPKTKNIPVIMVSIKTEETDVVAGLEVGAEDYIRKPYQKGELLARIRTALRRIQSDHEPKTIKAGPIKMDAKNYTATINGKDLLLRPKEYELLAYLVRREGQVLTHGAISQNVWQTEHNPKSQTINFHVVQLRKKLGKYGKWIKSLKGIGYRFEVDEEG